MPDPILFNRLNYADTATLEPALGGAFAPTLPFAHALTDDMSEPAQFASAAPADTQLHLDFGDSLLFGLASVLVHTFTQQATLRVVGSNNADRSAPAMDATFDLWDEVEAYGAMPYGQARYGGLLAPSEVADYRPRSYLWWKPAVQVRYVSLYFSDPGNASAPRFSRLILGPAFQPEKNFARDWGIEVLDPREARGRSRGRTRRLRGERPYRRLTLRLPGVTEAEALSFWQRFDREQPDGCLLCIPFPDRREILHETAVYGEQTNPRRNDAAGFRRFRRDVQLDEVN